MRYSLRNQAKIHAVTGRLNEILSILDAYFRDNDHLEYGETEGNYQILIIKGITLYVLSHKYDVYKLAFKEFNQK